MNTANKKELRSGIVWIISGASLVLYGVLALSNHNIPGMEQFVAFISSIDGVYIYTAAFLSIFVESLYVIGSFFPGTTLVVVIAILSQTGGTLVFLKTIFAVFVGWSLAGGVNILIASYYKKGLMKESYDASYQIKGRILTTWFPAFRANYEVAQISEGGKPLSVFWSSLKVKFVVSIVMIGYTAIVPLIIDIRTISNEEGVVSIFGVAVVCFIVGYIKVRNYFTATPQKNLDTYSQTSE